MIVTLLLDRTTYDALAAHVARLADHLPPTARISVGRWVRAVILRALERSAADRVQALVTANLGLAYSYAQRWRNEAIDLDELRQQAVLGLTEAATLYDEDKGPFAGFALTRMRYVVSRYVQKKLPMVHVPQNVYDDRRLVVAVQKTHPDATPAQLASATGLSLERVDRVLGARYGVGYEPIAEDDTAGVAPDLDLRDTLRAAMGGDVQAIEQLAAASGRSAEEVICEIEGLIEPGLRPEIR